jgi:exopolysaccharide biosynthesis polyprenyl glycosylphosphotransferase
MSGTVAERSAFRSAPERLIKERAPRGAARRWRGKPLVIGEDLFRDVLLREQKRADRFEQPFVLVMVALRERRHAGAASWSSIIQALTAFKRDTDVLGWIEYGAVLGLIVPEVDLSDAAFIVMLESEARMALTIAVDGDVLSHFAMRVHRHTTPHLSQAHGQSDPLLETWRVSRRERVHAGLKRALDVCVSAALLAVLSPLFLAIALLVKLKSPGPVFFRQSRVGRHGKQFTMLKFRTMHVHADHAIHKEFVSQLIKGSAPSSGDPAKDTPFKIANDPRVTAVGHVLRKTSLDEFPQLWNVLLGDMSLVGPRPPLMYEVEQYRPWHYRRILEAKPGMTGLWQVSGRSRTTFDDMVRLDLRYAKDCTAWTDIKILLATPKAVISGKGAV